MPFILLIIVGASCSEFSC
nr:sporulation protein YjcZ [Bacillus nitratireducens]